jgi:hypothetical protein
MPTSKKLLELADRCAEKLDLDGKLRHLLPSPTPRSNARTVRGVSWKPCMKTSCLRRWTSQRQEELVEQIAAALPEGQNAADSRGARDNHARHVWLRRRVPIMWASRWAAGSSLRREHRMPRSFLQFDDFTSEP